MIDPKGWVVEDIVPFEYLGKEEEGMSEEEARKEFDAAFKFYAVVGWKGNIPVILSRGRKYTSVPDSDGEWRILYNHDIWHQIVAGVDLGM